jgi:hypothetical protein
VQIIDIIALAGFDVHAVDHGGTTVLHYAAFVGHCDAVEKLIVMGGMADLEAVDGEGETPLRRAVSRGRAEVVHALRRYCDDSGEQIRCLREEQDVTRGRVLCMGITRKKWCGVSVATLRYLAVLIGGSLLARVYFD